MGGPRQSGYRSPGQRESSDVSDLNLAIRCAQQAIKLLQSAPVDEDRQAKINRQADAHAQVRMARATLDAVEQRLRRG